MLKGYPSLNLPIFNVKIKEGNGECKIFDSLRRKWLALTPEEWVRQHFVNWLITSKGYPASHIANEVGILVNGTRRRCDTIIYDGCGIPLIICEYKAPHISINQDVFDQIVRYNMSLRVSYLVVSNGLDHFVCKIDYANNRYYFVSELPAYSDIC